jgi:hypothetical protein
MCRSLRSDALLRDRPTPREVDDEWRYERSQIESTVATVGEGVQYWFAHSPYFNE